MWKYISGIPEPPTKKAKTKDERLEAQRCYDKTKRERSFQSAWLSEFEWLSYDSQKKIMTCKYCIQYEKIGSFVTGCENFKVQALKKHDASEGHSANSLKCKAKMSSPGSSQGEKTIKQLNNAAFKKLIHLFRNAHYIAKTGRPYADYVNLCHLDRAKGLDIGQTYTTDKYCAKFVGAIADVRKHAQNDIINRAPFISVISDGSTDVSSKEAEIVLVRSCVDGEVYTHLIGVQNVPKADSANISQAIGNILSERFQDKWQQKLIGMGTDGASVMIGQKTGVVQKMRELTERPFIHAIHCSAHRLELAYKDANKVMSATIGKKCEALLLNLYLFYKYSPLNRANLMASFNTLAISPKIPTRMGGTRWLPHTRLAIKNILHGYDAIVQHLQQIQNPQDPAHRKDSAAKGKHFLKLLLDSHVRIWLHFLLDVVICLSMMSEAIQNKNACLADIWNELQSVNSTLNKYKESNGPHLKKLLAKSEGALDDVLKGTRINFLNDVVAAVNKRFAGDLHLFRGSSFISFQNWPSSLSDELADFGDCDIAEVIEVCAPALIKVGVDTESIEPEWGRLKTELYNSKRPIKSLTWKELHLTVGDKYPNFFMLVSYLLTLPSSSVDAERGFSRMKMVKNDWRNRLGARHLTDLMIICSETDDISEYNPEPAIHLWNTTGLRSKRPFYMDEMTNTCMGKEAATGESERVEDVVDIELEVEDIEMADNNFNNDQDSNEPDLSDDDNFDNEAELAKRDIAMLQNKAFKQLLSLSAN